jgi:large subunit ribosomal protein L23
MRPLHYIIKRPLLSEKVTSQADRKVVAFEVARDANKVEVKQALEKAFDIKVQDVKTLVVAGKIKRTGRNFGKRSNWKKAYITLTPESNMDFFGV